MNIETSLAVYLIFWWVVLFSILPMGVVSHAEAGVRPPGGGDPASPAEPQLKRKFITTTWVSAILFAIFSGKRAKDILATDALALFERMGLREHLTPQRSNGFRSMVERIRSDARTALAAAA